MSFNDFTDKQLLDVFTSLTKKSNFKFSNNDVKYARIATRDLGRLRGTKGFGNARSVSNLFERVQERQAARIIKLQNQKTKLSNVEFFTFEKDDILGPNMLDSFETTSVPYMELQKMIGLDKVKDTVKSMLNLVRTNAKLKEEEKPLYKVSLNRLFLGNPGTGKTTVAKLYAGILRDMGLLSKGEVIIHTANDFVGAHVGHSEQKTNVKSAEGSVLVIDEAYGLFPGKPPNWIDSFRAAAINTIVEKVQNVPGEDRCVIMLGYKEQIEEMLRYSNPGLARRFQIDDAFLFEDYNDEALLKILSIKLKEQGATADLAAKMAALQLLSQQRTKPNFGNGGAVANLVSSAVLRMQNRGGTGKLSDSDFGATAESEREGSEAIFEGLIGCKKIIEVMEEYLLLKQKGIDPFADGRLELNFRFVGPPGTGKTTVAQRMGRMFKSLGILQSDDVVSKSASDFVTGFTGQSGQKTRDILTEGLGKVLFIDEAYRLNGDKLMQDAVNELVQALTEPKFQGKVVVVLAGYEKDMDDLMRVNQGLRSRFSQKIKFENFSVEDSILVLKGLLKRDNLQLDESAVKELPDLVTKLVDSTSFSNGRDIATWAKRIFRQVAKRFTSSLQNVDQPSSSSPDLVTCEDLRLSLESMLDEK